MTVAVTEDLDRVRGLLLELVKLNDYNVALELQAWLNDERDHIQQRFDLRERVFKALTAAHVEMPLETIQLAPHFVRVQSTESEQERPTPTPNKDNHV